MRKVLAFIPRVVRVDRRAWRGAFAGWLALLASLPGTWAQAPAPGVAPAQPGQPAPASTASTVPGTDKPAAPVAATTGVVRVGVQRDVFSRPVLTAPSQPAAAVPQATTATTTTPAASLPWRPPLRAIVMAGAQSMVLVDRAVVEIGGSVEGFRLDAVNEDHAVFIKGRERVVLWLGKTRDLE